ncbi:MAG TPA: preprotein translocase subunit SecE [Clostridiales bacterium]|nr:preprotein translocase subunit SecE [Clostridiales bacterium]
MLVFLLAFSFTLFANAEESGDVSAVSETSDVSVDATSTESTVVSAEESVVSEAVSDDASETIESDVSDESAAAATDDDSNPWLGWIIAGVILLLIALGIFIAIKRNTPFGQKLVKIFKDYKSEIKKIVWLSKKELIRQTGIVVVTVVIAAVFLGGLDWAFSQLIQLIA